MAGVLVVASRFTVGLLLCVALGGASTASSVDDCLQTSHGESGHHQEAALYVLFAAILMGTAILHLHARTGLRAVPFSVIVFILGVFVALFHNLGAFSTSRTAVASLDVWLEIDPHLLLFVFLPPLLFADAMSIDTHVARKTFGQCVILAGPGVLIGAFATAAVLYCIPAFGFDMWTSLMVGSILAATDPVAVVGLLKDLGASPILTMQIQGESLLNDGTSVVLFNIAYAIASGHHYDAGKLVFVVLKSTFGAWLFGMLVGWIFYKFIQASGDELDHNSAIVQISLTLCCAYWSFLFAEGIMGMSGVLAAVAAGFVLAHRMWPALVQRQAMREFWHLIETFGNIVVFFLAGLVFGSAVRTPSVEDYVWLMVVYGAVTLIRFVLLIGLRPVMNLVDFSGRAKVSYTDVLVMTWGGLRGMVGLALAMLVQKDRAKGNLTQEAGDRILFIVGGIAALTLLVNATTSPALCSALGVTHSPASRDVLVQTVASRAEEHIRSLVDTLANDQETNKKCRLSVVRAAIDHLGDALPHNSDDHPVSRASFEYSISAMPSRCSQERTSMLSMGQVPSAKVAERMRRFSDVVDRMSKSTVGVEDLIHELESQKAELLVGGETEMSLKFEEQFARMHTILIHRAVDPRAMQVVRDVFLEAVRASYWEQLQRGRLAGGSSGARLLNSVSLAKDQCDKRLADWQIVEQDFGLERVVAEAALDSIPSVPSSWLGQFLHERRARQRFEKQLTAMHLVSTFIEAHQHAQTQITAFFSQGEEVDTPEQAYVIMESQIAVMRAISLRNRVPEYVQSQVQTMWEVRRIFMQFRTFILGVYESGVLQAKETEKLLHPIEELMQTVKKDQHGFSHKLSPAGSGSRIKLVTGSFDEDEVKAALSIQKLYRGWQARQAVYGSRLSNVSSLLSLQEADVMGLEAPASPLQAPQAVETMQKKPLPRLTPIPFDDIGCIDEDRLTKSIMRSLERSPNKVTHASDSSELTLCAPAPSLSVPHMGSGVKGLRKVIDANV